MEDYSIICAGLGFLGLLTYYQYVQKKSIGNLPPGPRPLPIVGNAMDLPPSGAPEYQHWIKHRDLYGPISSISTMGQTLVIVHDKDLASEILNKKSLKTSDRPATEMASAFRERTLFFANLSYTPSFQYIRKFFHLQMGTQNLVKRFREPQESEAQRLLVKTLDEPSALLHNIQV